MRLFVGYGSFYLCRANLEAALPLLVAEGYDKTVLVGRRLMLLAIGGSVVCSLAFGQSHLSMRSAPAM